MNITGVLNYNVTERYISYLTYFTILIFCIIPIFITFPYRPNIYVTWEGAYRLYLGQVPFKDFGLPLGMGFWLIPALFFKLFGPFFSSLVKAQVLINLISCFSLVGIFKLLKLKNSIIFLSILLFCISFVMINFWPWYNHTVFVFELVSIYFLLLYILKKGKYRVLFIILAAFFTVLSIFTKQDGGGLGLIINLVLLVYFAIVEKKPVSILYFFIAVTAFSLIHILPFLSYDFNYWFNHGQPPHYSRINSFDFINSIFAESTWIKFYLIAILIYLLSSIKDVKALFYNRHEMLLLLLTTGILVQALIIRVTSFSPPTANLYFHTFAIAYLLSRVLEKVRITYWRFVIVTLSIFLWWSADYWKYTQKVLGKFLTLQPPPKEVVSRGNWAAKDTLAKIESVKWVNTPMKSLHKITIPEKTYNGIKRFKELYPINDANKEAKVLNMSELTFLAYEAGFIPLHGPGQPLWYHKGVNFFDREVAFFCRAIENQEFDIILFQDWPDIDNYFPYEVRECLQSNYVKVDEFPDIKGFPNSKVEVYVKLLSE